jgi:hypothetical protein
VADADRSEARRTLEIRAGTLERWRVVAAAFAGDEASRMVTTPPRAAAWEQLETMTHLELLKEASLIHDRVRVKVEREMAWLQIQLQLGRGVAGIDLRTAVVEACEEAALEGLGGEE